MAVQIGINPTGWKPMNAIGAGVKEIRIQEGGEFRVIYVAKFVEAVYVLHAFPKKSNDAQKEINQAEKRLKQLSREREWIL